MKDQSETRCPLLITSLLEQKADDDRDFVGSNPSAPNNSGLAINSIPIPLKPSLLYICIICMYYIICIMSIIILLF
jgi:hypothetical protein